MRHSIVHDMGNRFLEKIEKLTQGTVDRRPEYGDTVSVQYIGMFENGQVFDIHTDHSEPLEVRLH